MARRKRVKYNEDATYEEKYAYLNRQGFTQKESDNLAKYYSMSHLVELPYFKRLRRQRASYVGRLKKLGYTNRRINNAIKRQYRRNGWNTIFDAVRKARDISIQLGEYFPIKRKGSHHPTKSQYNKNTARNQRRRLTALERYEEGRGR